MPAKKKSPTTPAETEAKPAAARKRAPKTAAPAAAAPEVKPAAKTKSAAATHKAPVRRTTKKAAPAFVFDVEANRAEIEREAYLNWVNRGYTHGDDTADWLRAVETVRVRKQAETL